MDFKTWKQNYDKNSASYTIPGSSIEIAEDEVIHFNCAFPNKKANIVDRIIDWTNQDDEPKSSIFSFVTVNTVNGEGKKGTASVMMNSDLMSTLEAGELSGTHGLVAVGKKAKTSENIYPRYTFQIDPLLEN